ncbi:hypothetical protein ABID23_000909 [Bartonella silvatica]|uniref:Lectin-like protein BA14k n=1 Tax=Bartonella silvatica TaxID=357760 RepID=A0ABV2HI09_9HYPH
MKNFTKLAVLSAISTATILVPLDTTLADITWSHGDHVTREMEETNKKIDDMMKQMQKRADFHSHNFGNHFHDYHHHHNHHVDRKKKEQKRHHVERKTYHYVERKTVTHRHIHKHHVDNHNSGDALAAGILGLAAGAVLGNVLKKPEQPQIIYQAVPQQRVVYQEVPQVVYQQIPQNQVIYEVNSTATYQQLHEPWTRGWLQYCKKKYRSFNPKTGTFRGYDGLDHLCYAPLN